MSVIWALLYALSIKVSDVRAADNAFSFVKHCFIGALALSVDDLSVIHGFTDVFLDAFSV